ncbi:MAG: NAD-glutamate dehydrogenase domain-containing protein [Gordonia sp. (in: high G+C Gram-positive bacteria)]|uniref:NAD-glutamate dehydrogenase domain-containing protein n=1 Tax=Gordonia sp. (in: high G+C Gram-positive bacteria) TaxID=84139 RepID=UPI003C7747C1
MNTALTPDDVFTDALIESGGAWLEEYAHRVRGADPGAVARAQADLAVLTGLADGDADVRIDPIGSAPSGSATHRVVIHRADGPAELGEMMPVLAGFGLDVLEEKAHIVTSSTRPRWMYEFTARTRTGSHRADLPGRFRDAVRAIWAGHADADGLNELITTTDLTWRDVVVLRACGEYLRQAGLPYGLDYIGAVLRRRSEVAVALVELFRARLATTDQQAQARADDAVEATLAEITALDEHRILQALRSVIMHTMRTNHFAADPAAASAFKLDPRGIDELPQPRPRHEFFVYSPRIVGVHMRYGAVARGGLRWSERRDDLRTEVLGLVKAQAVKNALIVPAGAKGGFVLRSGARDRDSGVAGYREFIGAMLDLTDDIDRDTGAVLPAPGIVRRDEDDTYLVVAADKGTATFSDIANEIAASRRYWLGDAFASGGSVGYDHKAMGITARGAWESVTRRFGELGLDCLRDPIVAVGIGDMSGDVFGNGMLRSRTLRLVAAFDHRHVFLDPDPDAARSHAERERLFGLARSSWADYDATLISAGGGVYSRADRSIPISPQVAARLALDPRIDELSPPELICAILSAPADLLWNGGIGTYIRASSEPDAAIGDRANDGVRVAASQVRARVIGEGGNLGLTTAARIELARAGALVGTDALDNSAGVDCSDHEVNIKILLDDLVGAGRVSADGRTALLAEMTDEVAASVLADNVAQNREVGIEKGRAGADLPVHERLIGALEESGVLDRAVAGLPDGATVADRLEAGEGLCAPELATLMAYVKQSIKQDLLSSDPLSSDPFDLLDDPVLAPLLDAYFPAQLGSRFPEAVRAHRLRREILATALTNRVVDRAGLTFVFRLTDETGASVADAVRAHHLVTELFGLGDLWDEIAAAELPVAVSDELFRLVRRLTDRGARWFLRRQTGSLHIAENLARLREPLAEVLTRVTDWLVGADRDSLAGRTRELVERGVPEALARRASLVLDQYSLLDIVEIAGRTGVDVNVVGPVYYRVSDRIDLVRLLTAVSGLPRGRRWDAHARRALRDDLYDGTRAIATAVAQAAPDGSGADDLLVDWAARSGRRLHRAQGLLAEISGTDPLDATHLTVLTHELRAIAG